MWKIVAGVVALAGLGGLLALKYIDNAITEHYSPGFVSESIADSRASGVFVSQPQLKSKVIRWQNSDYRIREVWIEQATQIKYDWFFFKRVIPRGYRLIFTIDRTGNPPGQDFLYFRDELVCNGSIELSTTQPSTPILMYGQFSSTVPTSIKCLVKQKN
jgi:hypothetical protein